MTDNTKPRKQDLAAFVSRYSTGGLPHPQEPTPVLSATNNLKGTGTAIQIQSPPPDGRVVSHETSQQAKPVSDNITNNSSNSDSNNKYNDNRTISRRLSGLSNEDDPAAETVNTIYDGAVSIGVAASGVDGAIDQQPHTRVRPEASPLILRKDLALPTTATASTLSTFLKRRKGRPAAGGEGAVDGIPDRRIEPNVVNDPPTSIFSSGALGVVEQLGVVEHGISPSSARPSSSSKLEQPRLADTSSLAPLFVPSATSTSTSASLDPTANTGRVDGSDVIGSGPNTIHTPEILGYNILGHPLERQLVDGSLDGAVTRIALQDDKKHSRDSFKRSGHDSGTVLQKELPCPGNLHETSHGDFDTDGKGGDLDNGTKIDWHFSDAFEKEDSSATTGNPDVDGIGATPRLSVGLTATKQELISTHSRHTHVVDVSAGMGRSGKAQARFGSVDIGDKSHTSDSNPREGKPVNINPSSKHPAQVPLQVANISYVANRGVVDGSMVMKEAESKTGTVTPAQGHHSGVANIAGDENARLQEQKEHRVKAMATNATSPPLRPSAKQHKETVARQTLTSGATIGKSPRRLQTVDVDVIEAPEAAVVLSAPEQTANKVGFASVFVEVTPSLTPNVVESGEGSAIICPTTHPVVPGVHIGEEQIAEDSGGATTGAAGAPIMQVHGKKSQADTFNGHASENNLPAFTGHNADDGYQNPHAAVAGTSADLPPKTLGLTAIRDEVSAWFLHDVVQPAAENAATATRLVAPIHKENIATRRGAKRGQDQLQHFHGSGHSSGTVNTSVEGAGRTAILAEVTSDGEKIEEHEFDSGAGSRCLAFGEGRPIHPARLFHFLWQRDRQDMN